LDGVKLTASGFSNLTQDHFDYHPSLQDYFTSKARLFIDLTPRGAPVVINTNDKFGKHLVEVCEGLGQDVLQVGWTGNDIRIDEVMPHGSGQLLSLVVNGTQHKVDLPLVGEFQALNAVAALGLAMKTGVDADKAVEAFRQSVLKGCPKAAEIGDRALAIEEGIRRLGPQDCLVIAGKGHEQGQIVGKDVIPFSDIDVARGYLS